MAGPAVEDIRIVGRHRRFGWVARPSRSGTASACGVAARRSRAAQPLVLWTVEDITRDRERQDNAFLELQRAIDYLDHAPGRLLFRRCAGRVQYLNSTLADWLGYDLAEFEAKADPARRYRARRRREPVDARPLGWRNPHRDHRYRPRRAATARPFPVRLMHRAAAPRRWRAGRDAHAGARPPAGCRQGRGAALLRSALLALLQRHACSPSRRSTSSAASSAPTPRSAAIFDWAGGDKSIDMQPMAEPAGRAQPRGLRQGGGGGAGQPVRDRSGRRDADPRLRPCGAALRLQFRGRRGARAEQDQRLRARYERAAQARGPVRAGPEDAGRGPAGGRRGA